MRLDAVAGDAAGGAGRAEKGGMNYTRGPKGGTR